MGQRRLHTVIEPDNVQRIFTSQGGHQVCADIGEHAFCGFAIEGGIDRHLADPGDAFVSLNLDQQRGGIVDAAIGGR